MLSNNHASYLSEYPKLFNSRKICASYKWLGGFESSNLDLCVSKVMESSKCAGGSEFAFNKQYRYCCNALPECHGDDSTCKILHNIDVYQHRDCPGSEAPTEARTNGGVGSGELQHVLHTMSNHLLECIRTS